MHVGLTWLWLSVNSSNFEYTLHFWYRMLMGYRVIYLLCNVTEFQVICKNVRWRLICHGAGFSRSTTVARRCSRNLSWVKTTCKVMLRGLAVTDLQQLKTTTSAVAPCWQQHTCTRTLVMQCIIKFFFELKRFPLLIDAVSLAQEGHIWPVKTCCCNPHRFSFGKLTQKLKY